jgi:hypothetical protein
MQTVIIRSHFIIHTIHLLMVFLLFVYFSKPKNKTLPKTQNILDKGNNTGRLKNATQISKAIKHQKPRNSTKQTKHYSERERERESLKMANLRTAMDSTFWDLNVSSPRILEGSARAIPGEPFPLDGARASRALRIQQLSLLGNGFPLGIIPSYGPAAHKELGSFSLQTLLLKHATSRW